jgi:hypothetical protein
MDTIEGAPELQIKGRPGRKPKPDHELRGKRRYTKIPDSAIEFQARELRIPRRFEAIFTLLQDGRSPTAAVLTREELDEIDATKLLPKAEKDALVKYWPHWHSSVQHVQAIATLRQQEIDRTTNAYKVAEVLRRKSDFDSLHLYEQMKLTAAVLDKQIQDAALVHAVQSLKDIATDEGSMAQYRLRVNFIKDAFWIRTNIADLSERLREAESDLLDHSEVVDETTKMLEAADKTLRGRGAS